MLAHDAIPPPNPSACHLGKLCADCDKRVELMRTTVRHENDLINHRTQWLVIFNGLALNAFGAQAAMTGKLGWWRTLGVSCVGLVVSLSAGTSLALAGVALQRQMNAFCSGDQQRTEWIDKPGFGLLGAAIGPLGAVLMPRSVIPAAAMGIWTLRILESFSHQAAPPFAERIPEWVCALGGLVMVFASWLAWFLWEKGLAEKQRFQGPAIPCVRPPQAKPG